MTVWFENLNFRARKLESLGMGMMKNANIEKILMKILMMTLLAQRLEKIKRKNRKVEQNKVRNGLIVRRSNLMN